MRRFELPLTLALALGVAGCRTDPEAVCENIGNCEQGGSDDWINACKSEVDLAKSQASRVGCAAAFDAWFDCAASEFECNGATAAFPGCEGKLATLDACLTRAVAGTACGTLASRTSACRGGDAGGADVDSGTAPIPPACTAARNCQAQCFLDVVRDVCAPAVDELAQFHRCASQCPTR